MPPKGRSPLLENPPPASSSEEEEEEQEEEVNNENKEEVDDGEDEDQEDEEEDKDEDEDEDDDEGTTKSRFSVKKHEVAAPTQESQSSTEGSDSDSDSQSFGSEPAIAQPSRPSNGGDPNIKPITTLPMDENPKVKKPTEKPKANITSTKRPASVKPTIDTDKSEKRRKKLNDVVEETEKKSSSRLWSEDDEIVILKGLLNYKKKGLKPSVDMNGFLDSIKHSLHVDVKKDQLFNKIRRLKQKHNMNVAKEAKGEKLNLKPHEVKSYEISKKVWGEKDVKNDELEANNGGVDSVATESKSKSRRANNAVASPKREAIEKPDVPTRKVVEKSVVEEKEEERNGLPSLSLNELVQSGTDLLRPHSSVGDFMLKEGLGLIGNSKKKELEQKWRKLQIAETKVYLNRLELIQEQTKMVLESLESSKC